MGNGKAGSEVCCALYPQVCGLPAEFKRVCHPAALLHPAAGHPVRQDTHCAGRAGEPGGQRVCPGLHHQNQTRGAFAVCLGCWSWGPLWGGGWGGVRGTWIWNEEKWVSALLLRSVVLTFFGLKASAFENEMFETSSSLVLTETVVTFSFIHHSCSV